MPEGWIAELSIESVAEQSPSHVMSWHQMGGRFPSNRELTNSKLAAG